MNGGLYRVGLIDQGSVVGYAAKNVPVELCLTTHERGAMNRREALKAIGQLAIGSVAVGSSVGPSIARAAQLETENADLRAKVAEFEEAVFVQPSKSVDDNTDWAAEFARLKAMADEGIYRTQILADGRDAALREASLWAKRMSRAIDEASDLSVAVAYWREQYEQARAEIGTLMAALANAQAEVLDAG